MRIARKMIFEFMSFFLRDFLVFSDMVNFADGQFSIHAVCQLPNSGATAISTISQKLKVAQEHSCIKAYVLEDYAFFLKI